METQSKPSLADAIQIYSIWVGTITQSEARRQHASSFYLSVVAALGAVSQHDAQQSIYAFCAIAFVATLWLYTIKYFQALAKAKFDVIEKMEAQLPLAPFREEWILFKSKYNKGRLFGLRLSTMESLLPIAALLITAPILAMEVLLWINSFIP